MESLEFALRSTFKQHALEGDFALSLNIENLTAERNLKRKRSPELEIAPTASKTSRIDPKISCMLRAILDGLCTCLALARTEEFDVDTSVQSLRISLKADPELAATILGHALMILALVTPFAELRPKAPQIASGNSNLTMIPSLWSLRDQHNTEVAGAASDSAFTKHCFLPALAVLQRYEGHKSSSVSATSFVENLQRLVILHVVFPIRSLYFSQNQSTEATTNRTGKGAQHSALSTNIQSRLGLTSTIRTDIGLSLLPVFLDTTLRAVPLNSKRKRQHESTWIQILSEALFNLVSNSLSDVEDQGFQEKRASCLGYMLHVLHLHSIPVPLKTLVRMASNSSIELFQKGSAPNWALLAHIIKNNVNVFIPNAGLEESPRLLDALMAPLTSLKDFEPFHRTDIAIPLIEGFGRARDIFTLLDRIRTEIATHYEASFMASEKRSRGNLRATLWVEKDVLKALTSALKNALTPSLIDVEISRYCQCLQDFIPTRDRSILYASTIILDVVIGTESELFNVPSRTQLLVEQLPSIAINVLTPQPSDIAWQMPLWRLLSRVASTVGQHGNALHSVAWARIGSLALQVSRAALSPEQVMEEEALTAAASAFRLVMFLARSNETSAILQKALSSLNRSLLMFSTQAATLNLEAPSSISTITDIRSKLNLVKFCTAALLVFPQNLLLSRQESLLFLQALLQCADPKQELFRSNVLGTSTPFTKSFHGLVTHKKTLDDQELLRQIFEAVLARIEADNGITNFVVRILLELPLDFLPRRRRAQICDLVFFDQGHQPAVRDHFAQSLSPRLSLLVMLVNTADNTAKIFNDTGTMWEIVSIYSISGCDTWMNEEVCTRQYQELSKNVWKRIIASSDRRQKFISAYLHILTTFLGESTPEDSEQSLPCWEHLNLFVDLLRSRHDLMEEAGVEGRVSGLIEQWFVRLTQRLDSLATKAQAPGMLDIVFYPLTWTLNALVSYQELCASNSLLQKSLQEMERCAVGTKVSQGVSQKILAAIRSFRLRLKNQARCLDPKGIGSEPFDSHGILQHLLEIAPSNSDSTSRSRKDLQHVVFHANQTMRSLSRSELCQALKLLDGQVKRVPNANESNLAFVVMSAIKVINDIESSSRHTLEGHHLISLLITLQDNLAATRTLESFALTCDCIAYTLKNQPKLVTQFMFENIMGAIAICASPAGPTISPSDFVSSSIIYTRLTTLATNLISHHRKKLGGRFHLLLSVLRNLLQCLFVPHDSSTVSKSPLGTRLQRPPWVTLSATVSPSGTTSFTRLLTTITDPTPASVSKRQSRTQDVLTDPVLHARRTAAQYLQYLVIEYCACQLEGRLEPGVKAALMPGLFAILEIMDEETRKGMNGLMSRQLRDVFRTLWSEWGVSRGRLPNG